MRFTLAQRLTGLAADVAVIFLFGCVLVGAGHGVAPVGLLMFAGSGEPWGLPMAVGWLAIAALVSTALVAERTVHLAVVLTGVGVLIGSWALFIAHSASITSSVAFSAPFLAAVIGRVVLALATTVRKGSAS